MDKVCLVTGTAREMGLGTALVKRYLDAGYTVYASARHADLPHIAALKTVWGERLRPIVMDVTRVDDVKRVAEQIRAESGRLDILISNATATTEKGNLPIDEGCDIEDALNAYDVNAVGFIRMVQQFLPLFPQGATAAAITSEAGSMGDCWRDYYLDYGMAKAALNFACVTLQRRLGAKIRVLAIHPGWVQTRPAPPKADLTPEESAAHIYDTIASPPPFLPDEGNKGVFVTYNGAHKPF